MGHLKTALESEFNQEFKRNDMTRPDLYGINRGPFSHCETSP